MLGPFNKTTDLATELRFASLSRHIFINCLIRSRALFSSSFVVTLFSIDWALHRDELNTKGRC